MQATIFGSLITLVQGDITEQDVDAIVNAANKTLLGGGGVDGAIHRAAGPELLAECRRIREEVLGGRYLETAQPVLTKGYRLKARHVIHVVGPICGVDPDPPRLLAAAYRNSLQLAAAKGLRTIAFPSISTGAFGCDIQWASRVAVDAVIAYLQANPGALAEVRLVQYTAADHAVYRAALAACLSARGTAGHQAGAGEQSRAGGEAEATGRDVT
ncbi:O-acetyl-ADP-ribose deacetylase [Alicyclobacillus cellulosilyticus]|uniref:O-acetyl-ADP-ribose deacetylase n=1 Tax=Alicyclobacillus cellulosilyticus TaxID=1003997 RepID=A0A917K6C7_9BACL|nr:O-acetyl-ADP-ribose deacetylase [Alicyclobacillus cellulosilyticus]GGJ02689.1 O-acetyl-ADP-ribose deacetylase [Alicyclobacillus cellulosilyticus]